MAKKLRIFGGVVIFVLIILLIILKIQKKITTGFLVISMIVFAVVILIYVVISVRRSKPMEKKEEKKQIEEPEYYIAIADNIFKEKYGIQPINMRIESNYVGSTSTPMAVVSCNDYWENQNKFVLLINKNNINDITMLPINPERPEIERRMERLAEKPTLIEEETLKEESALTGIKREKIRRIPKEIKEAEEQKQKEEELSKL